MDDHTNAQNSRFTNYVLRTTRLNAQAKRLAMLAPLTGQNMKSVLELVGHVAGNTRDRVWVADAMRAGEIVCRKGALCLPEVTDSLATQYQLVKKELARLVGMYQEYESALEELTCVGDPAKWNEEGNEDL